MKLKIGRLTLEMSFPLVAVMTLIILYDNSLSVVVCFLAVLIHESGHLLALHHYGSFPSRIRLTLFDFAICDQKKSLRGLRQELVVILAGVTFNIIFALFAFGINCLFPDIFWERLFDANLTLAVFNSLPADSLDGGQAAFLLLCEKTDIHKATKMLDIISFIILLPIGVLGFLVLLRSKYNFSLLLTALYLIASIFLSRSKIFSN